VAMHYLPALRLLFGMSSISLGQWIAWLALGSIPPLGT
jgi:hypothetical protein